MNETVVNGSRGEVVGGESQWSEALEALESLEGLEEREKEIARDLLTYRDAVEDERLQRRRDEKPDSQVGEKHHRPAKPLNEAARMETTSWSFESDYSDQEQWDADAKKVARVLLSPEGGEVGEVIREIESRVDEELGEEVEVLSEVFGLKKERLLVVGSGSAGILVARKLLSGEGSELTTRENGSEVVSGFGEKGIFIDLRNHDNTLKTNDQLLLEYKEAIESGDVRFVSATLISKTGERYDGVVNEVAKIVFEYNRGKNAGDQVAVVVDVVQSLGREELEKTLKWLRIDGVAGIVHSGSKAPGGPAHGGFVWLSDGGMKTLKERAGSEEGLKEILRKHSTGGDLVEGFRSMSFGAKWRVNGNIKAIRDMFKESEDGYVYKNELGGEKAKRVREMYEKLFEEVGFRICKEKDGKSKDQVVSIIAMEPPEGLTDGQVHIMLTELARVLAKRGIGLGGFLKEKIMNVPILRCGIPIKMIREVGEDEIREQIKQMKGLFDESIEVARRATPNI